MAPVKIVDLSRGSRPPALRGLGAWPGRNLADPVAVIGVPFAVPVGVFAIAADHGAVQSTGVAPAPAHASHVETTHRTMANGAVVAFGKGRIPVLAFFGFILLADVAVWNWHGEILLAQVYARACQRGRYYTRFRAAWTE